MAIQVAMVHDARKSDLFWRGIQDQCVKDAKWIHNVQDSLRDIESQEMIKERLKKFPKLEESRIGWGFSVIGGRNWGRSFKG